MKVNVTTARDMTQEEYMDLEPELLIPPGILFLYTSEGEVIKTYNPEEWVAFAVEQ